MIYAHLARQGLSTQLNQSYIQNDESDFDFELERYDFASRDCSNLARG